MNNKILLAIFTILLGGSFVIYSSENFDLFKGSMFKFSEKVGVNKVEKNDKVLTVSGLTCLDSDGGNNYRKAGGVTLYNYPEGSVVKNDRCWRDGNKLQEYVCKNNKYKGDHTFDCSTLGVNYICQEGACIEHPYTIYDTTNAAEGFGYIDENPARFKEKSLPIIAVVRENIKVLVPRGYEALAKAHIEDLITCEPLLSSFFGGVDFPEDEIVMKIYVSTDDSNLGSSVFGKILYRKSQENIDFDLQDVITNNPEGFLFDSSENYCSNSHELTHAFFNGTPMPNWADEGLAQFTQKHNQGDIFEHIDCREVGYYSYGDWNVYSDMSSESVLDYDTAMCFVEDLVDTYGWADFRAMLLRLNKYQTGELVWDSFGPYHFVNDVLKYVYGTEVLDLLRTYGIEEEDYAA